MSEVETTNNWKPRFLLMGAVLGAVVGLGTAYLMARTAEKNNEGRPPEISTNDALKAGLNIIGLIRGIAALGNGR